MKKALLGAALLIAPFFSLANIFDIAANPIEPSMTQSCEINGDPDAKKSQWNEAVGHPKWVNDYLYHSAAIGISAINTRYPSPGYCEVSYRISYTTKEYNTDGTLKNSYTNYSESMNGRPIILSGATVQVPQCTNLGTNPDGSFMYPDHTNLGFDSSGQPRCFTSMDLADVDTCDYNSPWIPTGSSNAQFQCKQKDDGSICRYQMKTANGQSWLQPALEPDNCFTGIGEPYEEPVPMPTPPTGDNCQSIGNGITACPENPANVCDSNGLCQSGCGTVAFGGEEQFICLSDDTDGDGLGDYADPDIDGDGIRNDEDLDRDGDGFEDPVYPIGNNSSQSQHQSNVETLLAQIAQNTNGSSGGGSNSNGQSPTAQEIGESVGEEVGDEIAEKLTEIGDFSTTNFEQSVDAKVQASNESLNQFLESEDSDLTNAFDQSDFEGSYNNLKSALAPTGCTADISIPFTTSKLDLCTPAAKAQPFLYVIFAIATFIYCVRRIQTTVRKD